MRVAQPRARAREEFGEVSATACVCEEHTSRQFNDLSLCLHTLLQVCLLAKPSGAQTDLHPN